MNKAELEAQQARRKRINRMKTIIVTTIAVWMLLSFLAIVVLSVCLGKLNHRVHILEQAQNTTSADTSPGSDAVPDDTGNADTPGVEDASEMVNVDYTKVVRGIDTEDNMASEGDTHYVYLTFDSTPGANTNAIMDILDTYQVKATFFVAGDVSDEYYDTVRRIVNDGHSLGMHSFSNQYSTIYASTEAFADDLQQISDYLFEMTGVRSDLYRFPEEAAMKSAMWIWRNLSIF
jgi:hypothetical protein